MSTTFLKDLLMAAAPVSQFQGPQLRDIIQEELAKISLEGPVASDSGCLLANTGDFLVRATILLSQLAHGIVQSPHLDDYIESKTQEMEEDHDFSQLNLLDYLDAKHSSLKIISSHLRDSARTVPSTWATSPDPVFERAPKRVVPTSDPTMMSNDFAVVSNLGNSISPPPPNQQELILPTRSQVAGSDSSSDPGYSHGLQSDETILSVRGKGQHVCPHGALCNKGGVGPDGRVIVFERNSAFRAHLQKHEKKFKCSIPGCTNRSGFARVDQLRRHELNVQHGIVAQPPTHLQ